MEVKNQEGETIFHRIWKDVNNLKLNTVKWFISHNAKLDALTNNGQAPFDIYLTNLERINSKSQAHENEEILIYLLSEHISFDQLSNVQKQQLFFATITINAIKLLQYVVEKKHYHFADALTEDNALNKLLRGGFCAESVQTLRYFFENTKYAFNKNSDNFLKCLIENKSPLNFEDKNENDRRGYSFNKNFFRLLQLFFDFDSNFNLIDNSEGNSDNYSPAQTIVRDAFKYTPAWRLQVEKFDFTIKYLSIHKQQSTFFNNETSNPWKAQFMKTIIKEEENTLKALSFK